MTKEECAIVTAYTGFLIGDFDWFHEYVEKILERPVYTHELASKELWEEIKDKSEQDFINIKVER